MVTTGMVMEVTMVTATTMAVMVGATAMAMEGATELDRAMATRR